MTKTLHTSSQLSQDPQKLLLELAQLFITLPSDAIDAGINQALQALGEYARADRCWVIEVSNAEGTNTHEWCADGIESGIETVQQLPIKSVPWIASQLLNRQVVHVPDVTKLPQEAVAEKTICDAQDVKGFLAVPLLFGGELTGIVGFDLVREARGFSDAVIDLLKIAAEMIGNAVQRRSVDSQKKELDLRFRSVLDNINEGVSIGDLDDKVLYINPRYAEMLGYTVSELLGTKAYEFIIPKEEHYKVKEGTTRRTHGQCDDYECTQIRKDGTRIKTIINASPYKNVRGEIIGNISAVTDITAKKQTEAENERLQKRLLNVQKMDAVGQLAAGLAHDLNNSLSAIMGHLNLIKGTSQIPSSAVKSCDTALLGCKRASNLINQLLAFSRQGDLKKEPIILDSVVSETLELVKGIVGNNIKIISSGVSEHLLIQADRAELSQAITNLIINACHAMPKGGSISFSYSTTLIEKPESYNREATPGAYAILTVSDSGQGISPEVMPRIFEPFFSTKPAGAGTGLGLSMAYAIMQRHGGWIDVDSQEGMGTAFSLYFPLSGGATVSEGDRGKIAKPLPPVNINGQGGTILIIDDEPILTELASSFLERAGYKTQTFTSSQAAFAWYRKNFRNVSLVLLDMKMPELSGAQTFEVLREIYPETKIVLISGYIDDAEVSKLINRGALSFIQKPVKYTELVEWISKTIKVSKTSDSESFVH